MTDLDLQYTKIKILQKYSSVVVECRMTNCKFGSRWDLTDKWHNNIRVKICVGPSCF